MNPETVLIAFLGPLSGVIVAWIASRRSKKQLSREQHMDAATVRVSERDAHTREIAVILDGYTAVNAAMNVSLANATRVAEQCSEKYDALEERFEQSEERNRIRTDILMDHIVALEALVPNPPGPPERPAWP